MFILFAIGINAKASLKDQLVLGSIWIKKESGDTCMYVDCRNDWCPWKDNIYCFMTLWQVDYLTEWNKIHPIYLFDPAAKFISDMWNEFIMHKAAEDKCYSVEEVSKKYRFVRMER